jgi:hypothetical protein
VSNYSTLVDLVIKNEVQGQPEHERILELGKTPQILIEQCNFPDLTLAIKAKTIGKIYFDHGIPISLIKRLPEIISKPKILFKSANQHQNDSVIVLTFEVKNSAPIIIPIRQNQSAGRKKFNFITSTYAKEGPCPESKWRRDGLLIWEL